MDLASPITSVVPGVKGVVLGILARSGQPLTGRGIAQLADGSASQQGISVALVDLVGSGIVHRQPAGRANLYALNRQHIAADSVVALANLRDTLIDRIRAHVSHWATPAVAVWMFGSLARGRATANSDIDILIIRPDAIDEEDPAWSQQVLDLGLSVQTWTGNRCDVIEYDETSWADLVRSRDPLVTNVRADALVLAGTHPRDMTQMCR